MRTALLLAGLGLVAFSCSGGGNMPGDGGPPPDGGSLSDAGLGDSGFPNSYVGTVSDVIDNGLKLESIGTVTFVRDDAADPRGAGHSLAYYKVSTITYVAKASGVMGGCTYSANETVTVTAPPAGQNLISFESKAGGVFTHDITTTLSQTFPNKLTIACPPPAAAITVDFNAGMNVAAGAPLPTVTNVASLKASVTAPGQAGRVWSWDLTAQ